ncbi:hypothetical protein NCCP2331_25150 [Sporosarcina sp. NCCP-2331]|nr:hypothetical protein NCCP2331_25150 [Sporosarcina sp. NCCP-2331]GLB56479.1 hypothetical protein NCCP2378_22660 [Sporosarcina sp. NCCP-2378]
MKCKDVLLTLRFYSQKPFFVTALAALPQVGSPVGLILPESPPSTSVHWLVFQDFLCEQAV